MWQVSITTCAAREEAAARLLEEAFHLSAAVYHDARTGKRTATVYPSRLGAPPPQARAGLSRALRRLFPGRFGVLIRKLPRQNWAESWKRHFKPVEIGGALLIKPGWSRRRARPGQRVVRLDPGLSFGTGHHATTFFCLEQLAACRRPGAGQSFLDIGAGSGILAIAAAKLGYSPVQAFDFDPEAVRAGRANARRNRVGNRVRPRRLDLTRLPARSRKRYDVICANLTADLLAGQAGKIRARLKPGGQLIVAGILRAEFCQICDKFETFGLTLVKNGVNKEWHSGRFECLGCWNGYAVKRCGEKVGRRFILADGKEHRLLASTAMRSKKKRCMTKTLNLIHEAIRNTKHAFRQSQQRAAKAQKHRYERRKVKEIIRLNDWSTELEF
ncbi:MAG: 50S ribosomal protein L11 methyltransferase [Verrucomicrobiota bacterium]|jgi:ribosomal protein L11 methyltransferase